MSHTYLHLVSGAVIDGTADRIATMVSSRTAWDAYMSEHWGEVRYSHDSFVADAAARRGSTPGSYYLAHSLVVNRREEIPAYSVGVEVDQLLLDLEWIPRELVGLVDVEAKALVEARRRCGFRSVPERRIGIDPFTGQPMALPPRSSRRTPMRSENNLRLAFTGAGLSEAVATDLILINKLCNRTNRRADDPNVRYPLWALCAWDNYEGYLTGQELAELQPPEASGLLSAFRRAASATGAEAAHQLRGADVVAQARAAAVGLGPRTLCLAISSL
jgi:hypothetical protein